MKHVQIDKRPWSSNLWWKNVSIWWQRALFVTIVISRWEYKFLKCQFGVFTLLKNWKEESM